MVSQCPSCGRNMEGGQTVCTCGWRAEKPIPASHVIAVAAVGFLAICLFLGGVAALGVVMWKQIAKSAGGSSSSAARFSPTVTPQVSFPPPVIAPPVAPAAPVPPEPPTAMQSPVAAPIALPAARAPAAPPLSEIDRLVASLRDPNRESRQAAAEALQAKGWQPANDEQAALVLVAMDNPVAAEKFAGAAVDALCVPLRDGGQFYPSQPCAQSLGRILDLRAVAPLSNALRQSKDPEVRRAAAAALGRLRDPKSAADLRVAMSAETDETTRTIISAALAKVTDESEPDRLVAALKDDDPGTQLRAALLLAQRNDARGLQWMEQTINGDDPELREKTIQTLRAIGGPDVIRILIARVDGSGYDGPTEAVDALVAMGEPSIAPMVAALREMKTNGRWIMMIGLARLGAPAMHALTPTLPDAPGALKETVCQVLGGVGDRDDVPAKPIEPLVALLSDPEARIRRSAANSLKLLKWEPANDDQRGLYERAKH